MSQFVSQGKTLAERMMFFIYPNCLLTFVSQTGDTIRPIFLIDYSKAKSLLTDQT